jgi:signal transduction histidine kinase
MTRKHHTAGAALLVVAVVAFLLLGSALLAPRPAAQPGFGASLTEEERDYLESHGPIRYVYNDGLPPFTFTDASGAVRGINPDLLHLMSVNLGVEFDMVHVETFGEVLQAVSNGSVDLAGNLGATPEREATMDFTQPYAWFHVVLWTQEGKELPGGMAEARIGAVRGTATVTTLATAWPNAKVILVDDVRPGIEAVRNGSIDGFVGGDATTAYLLQQLQYFDIVVNGDPLEEREFSFAVPQNQTLLLSIIEKGLASITPAERTAIFVKWTGSDLGPPFSADSGIATATIRLWALSAIGGLVVIGVPLWIVLLRRKVAERTRELDALNATLERRVGDRTAELERTNKELEAFAYTVSHDLRSPLRAMDGFANILTQEGADKLSPETRRYLQLVQEGTKDMDTLVNGLLEYARLGRVAYERETVDVDALVRQVVANQRGQNPGRAVEVSVGGLPACQADAARLRQVFTNLLANAFKFTRKRTQPRIEVGFDEAGQAYFVKDNGIGFDMRHVGKLFGVFQRFERAEDYEGTGIGLAIVKRIVEAHGGRVWAEAAVGQGATFYFTILTPRQPTSTQTQGGTTP